MVCIIAAPKGSYRSNLLVFRSKPGGRGAGGGGLPAVVRRGAAQRRPKRSGEFAAVVVAKLAGNVGDRPIRTLQHHGRQIHFIIADTLVKRLAINTFSRSAGDAPGRRERPLPTVLPCSAGPGGSPGRRRPSPPVPPGPGCSCSPPLAPDWDPDWRERAEVPVPLPSSIPCAAPPVRHRALRKRVPTGASPEDKGHISPGEPLAEGC